MEWTAPNMITWVTGSVGSLIHNGGRKKYAQWDRKTSKMVPMIPSIWYLCPCAIHSLWVWNERSDMLLTNRIWQCILVSYGMCCYFIIRLQNITTSVLDSIVFLACIVWGSKLPCLLGKEVTEASAQMLVIVSRSTEDPYCRKRIPCIVIVWILLKLLHFFTLWSFY